MGIWNDSVDTIVNRLKDTLVYSDTGNHTSNYGLDLLNRAQSWLSMYRQWDFLVKQTELTVTNNTAQLPSDLHSIIAVFVDVEGIGKPTIYYYREDSEVTERYQLYDSFDPTTGHSWTIEFPSISNITGTMYIRYTYTLPTIESGQAYTFFPSNLLFRCAQKLHNEDKGATGDTIKYVVQAFNEELDMFVRSCQHMNQKMDLNVHDRWGNPLKISGHNLSGRSSGGYFSPYSNSALLTGSR